MWPHSTGLSSTQVSNAGSAVGAAAHLRCGRPPATALAPPAPCSAGPRCASLAARHTRRQSTAPTAGPAVQQYNTAVQHRQGRLPPSHYSTGTAPTAGPAAQGSVSRARRGHGLNLSAGLLMPTCLQVHAWAKVLGERGHGLHAQHRTQLSAWVPRHACPLGAPMPPCPLVAACRCTATVRRLACPVHANCWHLPSAAAVAGQLLPLGLPTHTSICIHQHPTLQGAAFVLHSARTPRSTAQHPDPGSRHLSFQRAGQPTWWRM